MNLEQIKTLIEIIEGTDVTEMNLEEEGLKINIKRGYKLNNDSNISLTSKPVIVGEPIEKEKSEKEQLDKGKEILAPMVGTFYQAPAPDVDPFVEIGDSISKGDTLCIIEAMKLMNEIEAEIAGKIIDILVEDGQPVEYGQPLFLIESR